MLKESELIYDWNRAGEGDLTPPPGGRVELDDETLRDGLQSPSLCSPPVEEKLRILHLMADLGIESADIGLPGAGPHVAADVERLAREIAEHKLPVEPNCAARTVIDDIVPIAEISQRAGIAVEVACFLGCSPIRHYAEGWDVDRLLRLTEQSVSFARGHDLPVMFVTEDTTRSRPEVLRRVYTVAVEAGAHRVCVADTVGHATPRGTERLIRFVREVVGEEIQVDWHGHKDRGLSVINSLVAAGAGASRLHGAALGIGERVGNCPMDLLLVNLHLLGWRRQDLSRLPEYCRAVAETTGAPLPDNYPVLGRDAFRTGTGVHAAAIIKAKNKGDEWLADRVYSSIPASLIGRHQQIEVGPMSGESNVAYWLTQHGIDAEGALVRRIFEHAKDSDHVLSEEEILALCPS